MSMNPDSYMQFRLNEASLSGSETEQENEEQAGQINLEASVKKKKNGKRGFTQMRGIWGRRDGEELLEVKCNEFGQPEDEMGTKMSNFIGTMIRDGKHGLLNYSSWHKVPMECKEKLWKILQSKFKLDESSKTWTMQKFGKKLRDWRNQLKKKCYKKNLPLHDQMKLKDPRVHEEHFEYLIGYWSTDRAQEISRRNQVSRSRRIHNHTTGTKSFARVRKEQRDQLAHVPTRAEQFKHCFTKKDGTQTVAVKTAIDKMQEIDNENPDASNKVLSRNDSYAQVMGLDKNGRVGMCGPGVCPSIVFNDTFTRGANENMLIKTLQHENHQLRSELHQFKSQAINEPHQEILVNDSTQGTEDLTPILQVAGRNDWELSMHGDLGINSQIGDIVCLKSIIKPTETIAIGVLYSIDPSSEVGEKELGPDHWEIYVQVAVKPNERLVRACRQYKTIGEAVGDYIAWPKGFVISKEIDSRLYG